MLWTGEMKRVCQKLRKSLLILMAKDMLASGTTKKKNEDVPFYAQISIKMKDTGGYGKNGFNYHKHSNFRDDYPYDGEAHVK